MLVSLELLAIFRLKVTEERLGSDTEVKALPTEAPRREKLPPTVVKAGSTKFPTIANLPTVISILKLDVTVVRLVALKDVSAVQSSKIKAVTEVKVLRFTDARAVQRGKFKVASAAQF